MNMRQSEHSTPLSPPVDVLVVGAGICGLLAATRLAERGLRVMVLDKGRSVGGRLATRRVGLGRADHGAQFFTARNERFVALVDAWRADNLVFRWSNGWSNGWSDGSLGTASPGAGSLGDGHPRFAVQGGMNALPKHLAAQLARQGVQIQTGVQVTSVAVAAGGWRVQTTGGHDWRSRSLVLTPPAPQSLALLAAGAVPLRDSDRAALERIAYAPCLCALFAVEGRVWLPAPGAVQRPQADIAWIADNQRKGISPYVAVFTLHGSPAWSAAHSHEGDEALLGPFRAALDEWTNSSSECRETQIKRWRYALPLVLHPQPFLCAADLPPLFFGGDAFGSPRVEGAAMSGLAIGDALLAA